MVIFQGFGQGLIAQTNFWNSRNAYLGQTLPGDTPEIFAPRLLAGKGEFSANGWLFPPMAKKFIIALIRVGKIQMT